MLETENIKYSLKHLAKRKSRSFLTVLSIFIGIVMIFIFVSFGWGLYDYVNHLAAESGADKFLVQARGISAPGLDNTFKLEEKDFNTINKVQGVKEVFGMYLKPVQVVHGKERRYTYGFGFSPTQENNKLVREMTSVGMYKGRELKKGDKGKVVLGYNFALSSKIFERPVILGDKVGINGRDFEVVGFFESVGNPQDDSQVYMSDDDIKALFNDDNMPYSMLLGRVENKDNLNAITETVKKELRKERGEKEGKETFFVQTYEQIIEQFSAALNIIIGFVIMIALISVLVSAVNTANTMVTSVLERTKEIGIMKAVGAKNSTIRNIFLFESGILRLVAGILGTLAGFIATVIAKNILANLGWSFLSPHYSPLLFTGTILFAAVVGTISGVTVAIQASRQNPVDALRYE